MMKTKTCNESMLFCVRYVFELLKSFIKELHYTIEGFWFSACGVPEFSHVF